LPRGLFTRSGFPVELTPVDRGGIGLCGGCHHQVVDAYVRGSLHHEDLVGAVNVALWAGHFADQVPTLRAL